MSSPRALVIRIGALGDVLLTRRLTYSLSRAGYRTTLFAPRRHAALLEADPWIEAVLDSESSAFAGAFEGSDTGITSREALGTFDLAVIASKNPALVRFASAISETAFEVSPEPISQDESIGVQWAKALEPRIPAFMGDLPGLPIEPARAFQHGATLLHPGSGSPRKNWPLDHFVELSRILRERGHAVRWLLGPAESSFDLPPGETALSNFDLGDLAATLREARLYVGNDSGVSHLAAAVGAPTVAIFGPTSDRVWRPDGPRVSTIRAPSEDLKDVSAQMVVGVAEGAL